MKECHHGLHDDLLKQWKQEWFLDQRHHLASQLSHSLPSGGGFPIQN